MPTVGEPFTFESIRRIREYVPTHSLTVWYDTLGLPLDREFYVKLLDSCDDVIVSHKSQGLMNVVSRMLLTLDYDYWLNVLADTWLEPGGYHRLMDPFQSYEHVACSGCYRGKMEAPLVWAKRGYPDTYPDGILLISRKAVNAIGGISPSFPGHGHGFYEWHMRAQALGYREAIVDNVMREQGNWHSGRDRNPIAAFEIAASEIVLDRIRKKGFANYAWWRSDL